MSRKQSQNNVVVYQAKSGAIELRGDFAHENIWATQAQIANVFNAERSVVTKHIRNILKDRELNEKSVCANFAHTAADGKTYQVQYYNLDMILAVGYRANSARAIEFRQWATKTLRNYIVDGYAINKAHIAKNYGQFLEAIENLKHLLPAGTPIDHASVLELISAFADTWVSLEAYDEDKLATTGATKRIVVIAADQLAEALGAFKEALVKKGEVSDLFGAERHKESIAGIVGNVMQSFGGKAVYPTAEERAAHLLYFMVKNHPFTDGNKRNGAYAFIWFLKKSGILNRATMTPPALTALTLFVAESDPKNKERMIRLILQLLR